MPDLHSVNGGTTEDEEIQEELFQAEAPLFASEGLSLRDIIKAKHSVETTVSIRSAEFPSDGGLLTPTRQGLALMTYQWEKPEPVPQWEAGKTRAESPDIVGWKVRQVLKPLALERLDGEADVILATVRQFMDAVPAEEAGALIDRLNELATEFLS